MPQPLFLHIRARARGTTRVVEVATDLVRIGRGVDCDARLDDPLIADVECFLRRHGETWHVQPLSDRGRLTIDGRPVTHLRAIALGVPLRVGSTIVVLRETANSATEFRPVEFQVDNDPVTETRTHASVDDDDRPLGDHPYDDPLKNLTRSRNAAAPPARDEPQPRRRVTTAERLWEAKWRAVGRSIQAQEARPVSTPISPKRAKVSEPAIVPFVPRHELEVRSKTAPPTSISDVEPVTLPITDLSHLETSVSQVSVHWGRSPDSVVTTAAGVVPFEPMHESAEGQEVEGA